SRGFNLQSPICNRQCRRFSVRRTRGWVSEARLTGSTPVRRTPCPGRGTAALGLRNPVAKVLLTRTFPDWEKSNLPTLEMMPRRRALASDAGVDRDAGDAAEEATEQGTLRCPEHAGLTSLRPILSGVTVGGFLGRTVEEDREPP